MSCMVSSCMFHAKIYGVQRRYNAALLNEYIFKILTTTRKHSRLLGDGEEEGSKCTKRNTTLPPATNAPLRVAQTRVLAARFPCNEYFLGPNIFSVNSISRFVMGEFLIELRKNKSVILIQRGS